MNGVVGSSSGNGTIKFLYSYGGRIQPRSTDGKLRYVGGHTRVLTVDRSVSLAELLVKLGESCGSSVSLRCQLPTEDLDTLVSVTGDDDLANLIEEYDRAAASLSGPAKIRAILSPPKSLKSVSPPPSVKSTVVCRALEKSPLVVDRRRSSRPYAEPVAVRGGGVAAVREPFRLCYAQGNPTSLYLVPYWNQRH